jgi:hypothetical protein
MARPKKYPDGEKASNRERYELSRGGSLTSYAGLIGDQFSSQVNLLAQVIRDAHEYSLGRYKERLLAKLIAQSIPSRYAVGTGFVLFPTDKVFDGPAPKDFDAMNRGDHEVSRQCDIIIYDAQTYPVIFKDDDFVVVAAEATRAVIEVKGSLDTGEIDKAIEHFIDFGSKWHKCDTFYRNHFDPPLHEPSLFVLAWQVGVAPDGTPKIDRTRLRERIADKYTHEVKPSTALEAFPYLNAAFIYNDCEVHSTINFDGDQMILGFWSKGGKLHVFDGNQKSKVVGDATIANLLAGVHASLNTPFNRFISYKGEVPEHDRPAEFKQNFSPWLKGAELDFFKWAERRKTRKQT